MGGYELHPGDGKLSNVTNIGMETKAKISNFQHEHYGAIGGKITRLLGIKL